MSELNLRMQGFARQQLGLGKGEWWIVDELVRLGHIDRAVARALVRRVSPQIYMIMARRRLPFFRMGVLLTAIGFFLIGGTLAESSDFFGVFLALAPLSIGACLLSYGLPGLRPYRLGDPAPGPGPQGPVRLGLTLRAEPFEKV
jgi:hypothetical protein